MQYNTRYYEKSNFKHKINEINDAYNAQYYINLESNKQQRYSVSYTRIFV